jgi:hypothetical protein
MQRAREAERWVEGPSGQGKELEGVEGGKKD